MIEYKGRSIQVTRALVEAIHGKLRTLDVVSHLCRTPSCPSINHLMPATRSMNARFEGIQEKPETLMTLEQARQWHLDGYRASGGKI